MGQWGTTEVAGLDAIDPTHVSSTRNGAVLTVLFDDFVLSLQTPADPLDALRAVHLRAPFALSKGAGLEAFVVDVRGSAELAEGCSSSPICIAGSAVHTLALSDACQASRGECTTSLVTLVRRPSEDERPEGAPPLPPLPPLSISLALAVQRQGTESKLLASVDSIDVRALAG